MRPSTRIALLAGAVVAGIVLYAGGWFVLSRSIETRADTMLAALPAAGYEAACDDLDVRGFPFRIGVFCNRIVAADRQDGGSLVAGPFRSAAQIYRPGHIVSELDGPAVITLPDGTAVEARWQNLRSSTVFDAVFDDPVLDRAALEGRDVGATIAIGLPGMPLEAEAGAVEMHVRRNGADLDAAASARRLRLSGDPALGSLPAFDVDLVAALEDKAAMLGGASAARDALLPVAGRLVHARIAALSGGALTVSGPFDVDGDGRVSGRFSVAIDDLDRAETVLRSALAAVGADPDAAGAAMQALAALSGGGDSATLSVTADRGRLTAGFIPLGTLPPMLGAPPGEGGTGSPGGNAPGR